jgi:integration host factor subunit beta
MTRSELTQALAQRFPQLSLIDAEISVKELLAAMGDALTRGGRIEIHGFGSFLLNYRPPRTGRNPKTGVLVDVPGKWAPHFRPGKGLRERITSSLPMVKTSA